MRERMDASMIPTEAPVRQPFVSRMGAWLRKPRNVFELLATALFLLGGVWVLMYYITGPALGYFHSDCTDSLIWAQVMVDTGEILSPDFAYAALLPFGSPFWMVPILKLFGFTMKAQTVSMAVFALLMILSSLFLFRSMRFRYSASAGATFCLCMLLSSSVKLREIMWEHVIYYSLGILLFMLVLGVALRLADCLQASLEGDKSRKNSVMILVWSVLLALLCVGSATDGFQMLVLTVIPVAGAFLAAAVFDGESKLLSRASVTKYGIAAYMGFGVVIGMAVLHGLTNGGQITAGYEDAYSKWSAVSGWVDNALAFPKQYLTLIGVEIDPNVSMFSMESILMMVRLLGGVLILICPILLLARYRKLRHSSSKILAWAHLLLTAVILMGFICGKLSNANWRLIPMLGTAILTSFAYFRELLSEHALVPRRVGACLAAVLVCCSFLSAKTVMEMPKDYGADSPFFTIADTLEEKGYTRGYATFWQSSKTTLMSDSRVQVITVNLDAQNGVTRRAYQTMSSWFDDVEGQETYFLLLTKSEYQTVRRTEYWKQLLERRSLVEEFVCEDYYIVVFDGNVFLN